MHVGCTSCRLAVHNGLWCSFPKPKSGRPLHFDVRLSFFHDVDPGCCRSWCLPLSRWLKCRPGLGHPLRPYSTKGGGSGSWNAGTLRRSADILCVKDLPDYVFHREFSGTHLYFYSLPQHTTHDQLLLRSREAAAFATALPADVLFLDCCLSRLKRLVGAAREVERAAAAEDGGFAEVIRQARVLKRSFSPITSIEGGLLESALLPVVASAVHSAIRSFPSNEASAGQGGGGPSLVPVDRALKTTARRLHERLLTSPTQMRAYRQWATQSLLREYTQGPLQTAEAAATLAREMRESFPSGYEVLIEERAEWAAHAIEEALASEEGRQWRVGLVVCAAPLTERLLSRLEALVQNASAEAKASSSSRPTGTESRRRAAENLQTSPPCLVPLLLLRFLFLPLGAACLAVSLSSTCGEWLRESLRRGALPEAPRELRFLLAPSAEEPAPAHPRQPLLPSFGKKSLL